MRLRIKVSAGYLGVIFVFVVLKLTLLDFTVPGADISIQNDLIFRNENNGAENHRSKSSPLVDNLHRFPTPAINKLASAISETSEVCPSVARPERDQLKFRNGYWQLFSANSTEVVVISAFFDDRPMAGFLPVVRLLAVSKDLRGPLYCQVWYADYESPYVTEVAVTPSGRGDKLDQVKYEQSLYTCVLPVSMPNPTHVSLVSEPCERSSTYLAMNVPVRAHWEHEFGVCVAIAFGKIPVTQFVEWIEFTRMFGVTEFNIYDGNISPDMHKLFQYYNDKKTLLQVYAMPPPVVDFGKKGIKLSSPASLNDCMLRNMYRYRYMVTIDFDELIIPKQHANYSAMLRGVDKALGLSEPAQSYTFRNVYHFKHFPTDSAQPSNIRSMHSRHHAKPSKFLYAAKSFIDPKTCLSVFNHFCFKRFTKEKKFTVDVDTKFAASHHYRECGFERKKCEELSESPVLDDSVLRFRSELVERVRRVLGDLGENSSSE